MIAIDYAQLLRLALPEVIVVATALIVMGTDFLLLRRCNTRVRFVIAAGIASIGCVAAIVRIMLAPEVANILNGVLVANPLTHLVQIAVLTLTIFTLLLSVDSTFSQHIGEFVLLLLVATAAMMFLAGTQGPAGYLYLPGTVEPVALYPRCLQQEQRAILGGRAEVLSLRRNVGGVSAIWIQPALRSLKFHQSPAHCRGHSRSRSQPSSGHRHRHHCHWIWV